MIKGGSGGANTNKTGLKFEKNANFKNSIEKIGFIAELTEIKDIYKVINKYNNQFGYIGEKRSFYKFFNSYLSKLYKSEIKIENQVPKKLLPDKFYFNTIEDKLYIIECKYQQSSGSTDEKIQSALYKKRYYLQLLYKFYIPVEYIYIWNEWFDKVGYDDVKKYLFENGIYYYINELPINRIGLFDLDKYITKNNIIL